MGWNKKTEASSGAPNADRRSGARPAATDKSEAAKPLSLLAQRLGALEESLTVVAAEIGVSGVPQFKHLEPEKVYQEAVRHARAAADQAQKELEQRHREAAAATAALGGRLDGELQTLNARLAALDGRIAALAPDKIYSEAGRQAREALTQTQTELDTRAREAAAAAGVLGVRLDSELQAMSDRIDDLDTKLGAMLQHLESLRRQSEEKHNDAAAIAALQQRLDGLEGRIGRQQNAPYEGLQRRIAALEQQVVVERPTEWPFADPSTASSQPTPQLAAQELAAARRELEATLERRLEHVVAGLEERLAERLQERIDARPMPDPDASKTSPFADAPLHHVTAADVQGLQESIATELAIQLARRAERNEQLPLLADRPADNNPLVINATERAIVRLTHRIEKLEGQLEQDKSQPRSRQSPRPARGLVGRLFES